ncbi:hypothetical protein [Endozoicomonas sp. GU-1]|uniref:hypothetical protein n=1 Tax=Endozoicomonas sp. GU-1 TaxID=3009078 RepID=UPI0022B598A6|nr:hypothetical protein [Endozoicomonas sp. GU-1]WBA80705.1 hypothetical protein O2T12_20675 [Endozoicomonas sp. GU-1]WBA88272.1 hypothetical protein O3276_09895 [Endozoicomonas sp. GU-1]
MDGILSKNYQQTSPLIKLLTKPLQEAGPSKPSVISIDPTRYLPGAQAEISFFRSFDHQSVGMPHQEISYSTTDNDSAADSPILASIKTSDNTASINRKRANSDYSENKRNEQCNKEPLNTSNETSVKRLKAHEQKIVKPDNKYSSLKCHNRDKEDKECIQNDQMNNNKTGRIANAIAECKRRKRLTKLYADINHALRDITTISSKPTKKNLLLTCIGIVKKESNPNYTHPNRQNRTIISYPANTKPKIKKFIKNFNEAARRKEIRELIDELYQSIPGTHHKKNSERGTLKKFLSFITNNPELKTSKTQVNQNLCSMINKELRPRLKPRPKPRLRPELRSKPESSLRSEDNIDKIIYFNTKMKKTAKTDTNKEAATRKEKTTEPKMIPKIENNSEIEINSETETDPETEIETDSETETYSETETDSEIDLDTDTKASLTNSKKTDKSINLKTAEVSATNPLEGPDSITEPDSPYIKTATFDSLHAIKEPANSNSQVNSILIQKTLQKPGETGKTLEHSEQPWFSVPDLQFLEQDLVCHEKEPYKTVDECSWRSPKATKDTHSLVTPPCSAIPSPKEQNEQEQSHTWILSPPSHPDISIYKPQTGTSEEPHPTGDVSIMQAVAPQEIFPWTPSQQMQDDHSSSGSSCTLQSHTGEEPFSEDEATNFFVFQQYSPGGRGAVPDAAWSVPASEQERTLFGFQQHSSEGSRDIPSDPQGVVPASATPFGFQHPQPEGIEAALYDMTETLPLASTSELFQVAPQNTSLITSLKNHIVNLKMSQADLEYQDMQTKNFSNEVINENLQLSSKVFNFEKELEILRTENSQLQHKEQLLESLIKISRQEEQQKFANLQRNHTRLKQQQIQTQNLLDEALDKNLQLSSKSLKLEQDLEILKKEFALLQKKDQLSESLVKFAFHDEQKKVADLEQKLNSLQAERQLMIDKIKKSDKEKSQLKKSLKNNQPRTKKTEQKIYKSLRL